MQAIYDFIAQHNEQLIQVTLVCIMALFCFLIFSMIRSKEDDHGVTSEQVNQLEVVMKNILQQSGSGVSPTLNVNAVAGASEVANSSATAEAAAGEGLEVPADMTSEELENLKSLVKQQEDEIKTLQDGANSPADEAKANEYMEKIQDLEARLQEYEIIEDDIADLSLYKEENQKLKQELEQLKTTGPESDSEPAVAAEPVEAAVEPVAEPEVAPTAEVEDAGVTLNPEVESTVEAAAAAEPEPEVTAAAEPAKEPVEEPAAEPIADAPEEPAKEPEVAAVEAEVVEAAAAEPAANSVEEFVTDDVLAEFSAAVDEEFSKMLEDGEFAEEKPQEGVVEAAAESEPQVPAEPADDISVVDTDKMMSEMATLASVEVSEDGGSALDEESDIEKMAQEASNLTSESNS